MLLTSLVLRFGVERDELEPERDGGRSLFNLLVPALSPPLRSPFNPMLSRSRDSELWSPLARGDGEP